MEKDTTVEILETIIATIQTLNQSKLYDENATAELNGAICNIRDAIIRIECNFDLPEV